MTIPFGLGTKLYENPNESKLFFEMARDCHLCVSVYYSDEISQKIKNIFKR